MVATVKIIPFAVAGNLVEQVGAILEKGALFDVHPFAAQRVGLIHTMLPGLKDGVIAKTTTRDRGAPRTLWQCDHNRDSGRLTPRMT